MRSTPQNQCYVLQLRPGGLERAKTNLARQNVTSFMPMRTRTQRRANRLLDVKRPLFPGYLFVEVDPETVRWRSINSTYGVAKAVSLTDGRPTPVPTELLARVRSLDEQSLDAKGFDDFVVGERVRVVSGPFAEFEAQIEAVPEKDRIYVLLDMMGREVRTEVKAADVELASAS